MLRDTVFIRGDAAEVVSAAERLSSDLAAIARGEGPTWAELEASPYLDAWNFTERRSQALLGQLAGSATVTSELFAIGGTGAGLWARTWSRWYRLGQVFPVAGRLGR